MSDYNNHLDTERMADDFLNQQIESANRKQEGDDDNDPREEEGLNLVNVVLDELPAMLLFMQLSTEPDKVITFTNSDPRIYDGLGEIQWQAASICPDCGNDSDFSIRSALYDGCIREQPTCNNCGANILGLPVDPQARALVEARRAGEGEEVRE